MNSSADKYNTEPFDIPSASSKEDFTAQLPVELLVDIFQRAVSDSDQFRLDGGPEKSNGSPISSKCGLASAVALSHVSSRWRSITINASILWTTVIFNLDCDMTILDHFCRVVFGRIGGAYCRIQIHGIRFQRSNGELEYPIEKHPIRVCRIRQQMNVELLRLCFLAEYECNHPQFLEYLLSCHGKILGVNIDWGEAIPSQSFQPDDCRWSLGKVIERAPFLRRIELHYVTMCLLLANEPNWPFIEELTLDTVDGPLALSKLLSKLPNLRKFALVEEYPVWTMDESETMVPTELSHQNLREITVNKVSTLRWTGGKTCFPSLQRLCVKSHRQLDTFLAVHLHIQTLIVGEKHYGSAREYIDRR
ncbi:SubName: Full=Uncharacterized protein {ECO:0000313/EMBL:CCA71425.1} [Serendipita indica DSM 11827]|uniref:Uncharacterized protein n=1 Tax=Serendipita indica (strain DSM 11827) TaxID=1109443 RepID=G4TJD2_SERID|nr:SubName: Full=Uncharacterized protein {ECO:0000313/EMBL:CCA71425.1} [Serendipita indica DSM 11827]CCA71425.1 hypothetical protein PIIN_05364 [Serendipita indica DSM 11827]